MQTWQIRSTPLPLPPDAAHVWLLPLQAQDATEWEPLLSVAERRRAARLLRVTDQRDYTVVHGMLRHLLAAYRHCSPAALRFASNAHGKPRLLQESADDAPLYFNLSHSQGMALLAVADSELGVDIEYRRTSIAAQSLAQRFFTHDEAQDLDAMAPAQRIEAFYRLWTRKEALLKAVGIGLTKGLKVFAVNHAVPPQVLQAQAPYQAESWALHEPPSVAGYAAALATRRPLLRAEYYQWPPSLHDGD